MKRKILLLALTAMFVIMPAMAKVNHLLPQPQKVTVTENATSFVLNRAVALNDPTNCKYLANFLDKHGCTIDASALATITVELVTSIPDAYDYELHGYENEAYTLEITANSIKITAITNTGVIRAAQTLTQLAEGYEGTAELEALTITDWPAFKLRGFMHDVGRSFISAETIKKHIDLLSRFKINTFHWHLTENQAWRFEVKKYPQLTETANMTRFEGKYYKQEECKEVEEYAAERGVIVIPEIDMPGHSEAFTNAMGYNMQSANGVAALQSILEEVASTFTRAPYIHIGADEVQITYPNFLKTMTEKIHSLNKKAVCWNPIFASASISSTDGFDMTQMWSTSGKTMSGLPNIDCRYNYTNHFDVFADLVGIYKSTIYYEQKGNPTVAGTISAYWNDRKTPTEEDIVKQNNFYANVLASASRAWTGGGKQYIDNGTNGGTNYGGGVMLPNSGEEYNDFADWERRFLFHKANSLKDEPIPYVKQTNVRWKITDAFPNGGDVSLQLPPETELKDSYTYNGVTYGTGMATGAGIYLRHTWGQTTINAYYTNPQFNHTAYAWTYVYSDKEQTVGAQIEFQNYARSEDDRAPEAGKWDYKGSRIWLNDEEILPPTWTNSGKNITNEIELGNENFTARKPIEVKLKEGWNKVFLKLPYISINQGTVRLNKWMFTFVLTDTDGKNAVEGLIYSPNKCLDENAELLIATISDIKEHINGAVSDQPGYFSTSYADALNAKIIEIEATLQEEMTTEERATQLSELNAALEAFDKALETAVINQPKASTADSDLFYSMCTPLRENRYATSKGAGQAMVGETTISAASYWKFVKRNDNTYDIINKADNTYVSPLSTNNTALTTVSERPSAGWIISPANENGYVIITSGTTQFNQTNNSTLGYRVYNWGYNSTGYTNTYNTSDTGCKYIITEEPRLPETPDVDETPKPFITLAGMDSETYPYKMSEEHEKLIFEKENITIALDLTTSGSTGDNEAFFAASDPTSDCQETDATATSFTCVGTQNAQARFFISAKDGQWHTRGSGISVGTRHKITVVFTKGGNSQCFINGTACDSGLAQNLYQHANNDNANFYIGGGVTNAGNIYTFKGSIHSVQFFDWAMNASEISNINYDVKKPVESGIDIKREEFEKSIVYDLMGRKIETPSTGIYIVNGKKVYIR